MYVVKIKREILLSSLHTAMQNIKYHDSTGFYNN